LSAEIVTKEARCRGRSLPATWMTDCQHDSQRVMMSSFMGILPFYLKAQREIPISK